MGKHLRFLVSLLVEILLFKEGTFDNKHMDEELSIIDVFDLTTATTWKDLMDYYGAIEKHWRICVNCGIPTLGTAIHLEHAGSTGSMQPAVIPTEYLLTRLEIVDLTSHIKSQQAAVITLDMALQWSALKHDPREPTLILFKFGWKRSLVSDKRRCVCKIPGLSYELAEWIAANMSHVVGVATDAPSLESEQTREFTSRTIANVLGKSGIYMIENVNIKRKMPERGCMVIAMPLKMLSANYVPTRLTAFCPSQKTDQHVAIALKKSTYTTQIVESRVYDVNLDELV
ncbi:uncharacterized protein LOC106718192 [Papilio machaon]|uniref:uncharacterized protein LOC106718192 n=1 Tax=Papilio machaon TaxID=76193 RepID=UPI001E666117|nr:uncharacterized protein LOC106718192 [Papilio machaon]